MHPRPAATPGGFCPPGRRRRGRGLPGPRGVVSEGPCRGRDVRDAVLFGLEGAVRHFLREDPRCVKETDRNGREAWSVARDGWWRGVRRVWQGMSRLLSGASWAFSMPFLQSREARRLGVKRRLAATQCRSGPRRAPRLHRPAFCRAQWPRLRCGAAAAAEGGHRGEAE